MDCGMLAAGNLVFSTAVYVIAAAMLTGGRVLAGFSPVAKSIAVVGASLFAALVTVLVLSPNPELLIPFLLGVSCSLAAIRWTKGLSFPGSFVMTAQAQFYLACLLWVPSIVASAEADALTRILLILGFMLMSVYMLIALIQRSEQMEVTFQVDLRSPQSSAVPAPRSQHPRISLHVPVYSEPPDLVIATLDALAELDYPNYEVLIIDNNTTDPYLWRPVEKHCKRLGDRFRFYHVDRLSGAKAGALNLALRYAAPDADLIGIVDSDYKVNRNFLASLVDYFDDPKMGFAQTPHAYRDWEGRSYLRMCNWEYSLYLASTLVSRNERMAAITLGTMGLIRRKSLEEAGGWSEWCLTEDSELALRLHAHGYHSVYVTTVFGRGLIPETFSDYKKQRFRWRYGSIQELRWHFRLYLPRPFSLPSALNGRQKLFHLMHGLDTLKSVVEFLLLLVGVSLAASMVASGESIDFPAYAWTSFAGAAVLACVLKWHGFRALGWSFKDALGAHVARAALDHTFAVAGLAALLTRTTFWRKTNKFRAVPTGLAALRAALPELVLGTVTALASMALLLAYDSRGLLALLALGGLLKAAKYLFAPFMAVLAEHEIRKRADDPLSAPIASP